MSRIPTPATIDAAPAASQPMLEAVKKQFGIVPNLFRLVSTSTAALEGYLGLSAALNKGAPRRATTRKERSRWRYARPVELPTVDVLFAIPRRRRSRGRSRDTQMTINPTTGLKTRDTRKLPKNPSLLFRPNSPIIQLAKSQDSKTTGLTM